jgi:hypothetical protein
MSWTSSSHCVSRKHCKACRGDRNFRQGIVSAGMAAEVDFACPLGLEIAKAAGLVLKALPATANGPGSILKKMIARIGIRVKPSCPCNARAAEMDARGCDWCAGHVPEIVDWMEKEAARRGMIFSRAVAAILVRAAIRQGRGRQKL